MRFTALRSLALVAAACAPVLAHADMYKCVGPNGVSIFSDRPCETQAGAKAAEIKNDDAFAAALARDNTKNMAQACMGLQRRIVDCRGGSDSLLVMKLREQCRSPIQRYRQSPGKHERDDMQYDDPYRNYGDGPAPELRCDALQAETFAFVKANFAKNISEQDMKTIEYSQNAVPSDGRPLDLRGRRKSR